MRLVFPSLLVTLLIALVDARDCNQNDVNNWVSCKSLCDGALFFPPILPACFACQAQADQLGYKDCYYVNHPPGYSPPYNPAPSDPGRPIKEPNPFQPGPGGRPPHGFFRKSLASVSAKYELFDTYAKGDNSFDRSAFLQVAKSDVFFDRKTHSKAFARLDANRDGQVTFDEMFRDL